MVYGRICSCCGEKHVYNKDKYIPRTFLSSITKAEGNDSFFLCQPCANNDTPTASTPPDMSVHTIPTETSVVVLDASKAFMGLTTQEKFYAYYLSKADWEGAKICLLQCSPESPAIFSLLQFVFSFQSVETIVGANSQSSDSDGLIESDIDEALIYTASFFGNMGNYKSFGDSKFVPALSPEKFYMFLSRAQFSKDKQKEYFETLWESCVDRMYSLPPRHRQLGLGAKNGISTYFSANCEMEDAALGGRFMKSIGLSPYNTRLMKSEDGSIYTIKIASSTTCNLSLNDTDEMDDIQNVCKDYSFEQKTFKIRRGDYAPIMSRIVSNLKRALQFSSDETQKSMLESYIQSFTKGSIEEHKQGSRYWIQDKGPTVESYIGFIESYRDPSGARGEWEGFVACVNREVSRKFGALVDHAEEMLKLMPWSHEFEKDVFLRPDFTSLEVLAFGSSGVPAGINIPNYDDIRQNEGFKNVSLGNVLAASYGSGNKPVTFLKDEDQSLFKALKGEAFEVQVGIHELLGHGSGKLYHSDTDDAKELVASGFLNPVTQEPITGPFYSRGSTWDSTFGSIASSYEECRAESCGIYLCLNKTVLEVFGHTSEQVLKNNEIHDISYINWLLMVRAGLVGLEFYTPETKEWRQAHMRARYVILQVLLEAGEGLVSVATTTNLEDGKPDAVISLDREKIRTIGKDVIGNFLLSLQTHKSLGDFEEGSKLYEKYSKVTDEMAELRSIVMARKEPRKLMVQPHLYVEDEDESNVKIKSFSSTPAGIIESFQDRFPAEDPELMKLYELDAPDVTD